MRAVAESAPAPLAPRVHAPPARDGGDVRRAESHVYDVDAVRPGDAPRRRGGGLLLSRVPLGFGVLGVPERAERATAVDSRDAAPH